LNKIKGAIEGRLGTPALSGKVSGSIDLEKSDTFSESETTISKTVQLQMENPGINVAS
jgi:hypothetical protein